MFSPNDPSRKYNLYFLIRIFIYILCQIHICRQARTTQVSLNGIQLQKSPNIVGLIIWTADLLTNTKFIISKQILTTYFTSTLCMKGIAVIYVTNDISLGRCLWVMISLSFRQCQVLTRNVSLNCTIPRCPFEND